MKEILLANGRGIALVDDSDFDWLAQYRWRLASTGYAMRSFWRDGRDVTVYMHRMILPTTAELEVDHINRSKIDNRRANLRIVTASENQRNRGILANNVSGIPGVSWHSSRRQWQVSASVDGHRHCLGRFGSFEEAATAKREFDRAHAIGGLT